MILDTIFAIFFPIAIIIITIYVGASVMMYIFQDRFIFPVTIKKIKYPEDNPNPFKSPSQLGLKYRDLKLKTTDGLTLHGWLVYKQKDLPNKTILYFHENAGNIGLRMYFIQYIVEALNINIILFDYRGYGKSEGKPSEKGLYIDGLSISSFVLENNEISDIVDKSKIFLFGRGIGGAVAAYVGSHINFSFCGMILENTFTSLGEVADIMFPFVKEIRKYLLKSEFDTRKFIGEIKIPILFCRSEKDKVVPKTQMERLFLLSNKSIYKDFYEVKNGTHNDGFREDKEGYKNAIEKFVDICVLQKFDEKPGKTIEEIYEDYLKEKDINEGNIINKNENKEENKNMNEDKKLKKKME